MLGPAIPKAPLRESGRTTLGCPRYACSIPFRPIQTRRKTRVNCTAARTVALPTVEGHGSYIDGDTLPSRHDVLNRQAFG